MGLGNQVTETFWLARFWFILLTLVTHRLLVLTPLRLHLGFSRLFLLKPSANRRVTVGTTEELWPGLPSGVSQWLAAQGAPVAATQAVRALRSPPSLKLRTQPEGVQRGFLSPSSPLFLLPLPPSPLVQMDLRESGYCLWAFLGDLLL